MIALLLFFLITISGSIFAAAVFQKRFEESLPVSIGGIPVILFFTGLLFKLQAAFILLLAVSGILLLFSFIRIIRKKSIKAAIQNLLTPGFVLYILLYAFLIYINLNRPANAFDEFSHWIDSTRAMFTLDDFGTAPGANTLFGSYPPGMSLFQYAALKTYQLIFPQRGFMEWLCYLSYQLPAFSFFFPLLKKTTWKTLVPTAGLLFLTILSVLSLYDYAITTCYIDPFIGITAGAGFAILCTQDREDPLTDISLLTILFILTLAKDVGLFFSIVLAAAMLLRRIIIRRPKGKQEALKLAGFTAAAVLAIALPKLLWKLHYTARGVARQFSQPINFQTVLDVLLGKNTGWESKAMGTYASAFFTSPQELGSLGIRITYPILLLLLVLLLTGIYFLRKKSGQSPTPGTDGPAEQTTQTKIAIITALIATALYSFGLSVIYLFKFGESGSMNLLSMDRYLRIPYLMLLIMGLLLLIDCFQALKGKGKIILFLAVCVLSVLIIPVSPARAVLTRSSVAEEKRFRAPYDRLAEQVKQDMEYDHPARVFIISQGDGGWDYYTLRYTLRPCTSAGWHLTEEGAGEGYVRLTPEQWREELKAKYDYVIIYRLTDEFTETYGDCFKDPVRERAVYYVDDGYLYEVDQ